MALLPDGHPLTKAPQTGYQTADLARFAAALGRSDEAMQISTASNIDVRVEDLLDIAVRSIRERPVIDLRTLLAGEVDLETATGALKALRASTANLLLERHEAGLVLSLADASLGIAAVTFFDVDIHGQDAFSLAFGPFAGGACSLSATLIDQATGATLCKATVSATRNAERVLKLPLHGVHGLFCLILDILPVRDTSPSLIVSRMQFA